ncbi:hypothetical protein AHF37_12111 [Paragonimus kellicotti]|nr:hypothetical protein AHF37_12111 [Paragonimus kellicotti]
MEPSTNWLSMLYMLMCYSIKQSSAMRNSAAYGLSKCCGKQTGKLTAKTYSVPRVYNAKDSVQNAATRNKTHVIDACCLEERGSLKHFGTVIGEYRILVDKRIGVGAWPLLYLLSNDC